MAVEHYAIDNGVRIFAGFAVNGDANAGERVWN